MTTVDISENSSFAPMAPQGDPHHASQYLQTPLQLGPVELPGRAFLAPMSGIVSAPFRGLAVQHGAAAAPTELISATALAFGNRRTRDMISLGEGETISWVQLFGADPEVVARAAVRAVEMGARLIDINMGCPVRKVTASGSGSALMQDPPRAERMVRRVVEELGGSVPVTVKFRSGWDQHSVNAVEFGKRLEQAGAVALCLHARTRAQRYSGLADWTHIARLKQAVQVPVIGNGDIGCVSDAADMLAQTGCDAVMIGRAAVGNPWIFSGLLAGKDIEPGRVQRRDLVIEHLQRLLRAMGDELRAVQRFRSRLLAYTHGLDGGVAFRRRIVRVDRVDELIALLRDFFEHAPRARGYKRGRAQIQVPDDSADRRAP